MNKIINANTTPVAELLNNLPNVTDVIVGWFQPLIFTTIVKSVVNFKNVEVETQVKVQGVRQPMTPQQLNKFPIGQRAWKWETIHADPSLILKPDDVVIFGSTRYRVDSKMNWAQYGYVEYHICEDFTT